MSRARTPTSPRGANGRHNGKAPGVAAVVNRVDSELPPNADDLEVAFLATCAGNGAIPADTFLRREHFRREELGVLYQVFVDLCGEHGSFDVPMLRSAIIERGLDRDEHGNSTPVWNALIELRPENRTVFVEHAAEKIVEASQRRELQRVLLLSATQCGAGDVALEVLRDRLGKAILDLPAETGIISAGELVKLHPQLAPPILDGLLRRGETCNVVAASKAGKSWLSYTLAFAIAYGYRWLDTFPCTPGRVLLLDNELASATLADRLVKVARALGVEHDWGERIDVRCYRGALQDLFSLESVLRSVKPGTYGCVVCDALYRFYPEGFDENRNADVARLYNQIDRYAIRLDAGWINVHHASKGDQSSKNVIDVGAGAGSQSRAADAHLVLRPHEAESVVVVEAAVRSFPPVDPFCARWEWPLWTRADDADPGRLRRPQTQQAQRRDSDDAAGIELIVKSLETRGRATATQLRADTGLSRDRLLRLLAFLEKSGRVGHANVLIHGNQCQEYYLL